MMKKQVILALMMVAAFGLAAQTHVLTATLRDATTSEPVAFANCALLRATDSTLVTGYTSYMDGTVRMSVADTGTYLLRVTAVGYENCWQSLWLTGDTALGVIALRRSATTLEHVNVTATRPLYSADGEKVFYHVEDDPSVQTGSMADALQNAPGVEVDAEGNITLRGSSDVTVWLNDRPSNLSGEALKQYIKALPASSVSRIEVLSNPSARYGSTGAIINIITNQRVQLNHLLSLGLNGSTMPYLQPWLSYIWANEKVSVNAWASGNISDIDINVENHERLFADDGSLSTDYSYHGKERQGNHQGNIGAQVTVQVDSLTNLTAWAGFYGGDSKHNSRYDIMRQEYIYSPGDYSYHSHINNPGHFTGLYYGVYLARQLDTLGGRLSLNVSGQYNAQGFAQEKERLYTVQSQLNVHHLRDYSSSSCWNNIDLDYVKPYSPTGQVEAGLGAVLGRNNNYTLWDTLDFATDLFCRDLGRTFTSRTVDNELSAYLAVQQKVGQRLTLKGGARVYRKWKQASFTDLPVATTDYDVDKAFWDCIPSLHASYSAGGGHSFTLSYTRRFMSPGAALWTTFEELKEESFGVGNPDLRFSHTHNLEGGWTKYSLWGSIGLTGYLRANTDEMQSLSDVAYHPFFGRIVQYSQQRNIGSSRTLGAEANITYRPRPFMNIRLYAGVYDYAYDMEFRTGEWDKRHLPTFSGRLNVWAKLWNTLQVYANAHYTTATLSLLSESKPSFQLDLGASADLLHNRLSLLLDVHDLLATAQSGESSLNPYYRTDYRYTWGSRAISLGLTYRFGKTELKARAREGVSAPTI